MTVLQPVAHWPKIDHVQAADVWRTVAANLNFIFITIGAFKYPILTIIASPIVADFQYVVNKYFTQIINMTDILLQICWGRILYSLDYKDILNTSRVTRLRPGYLHLFSADMIFPAMLSPHRKSTNPATTGILTQLPEDTGYLWLTGTDTPG